MAKMVHFFDNIFNDFTSKDKYVLTLSSFTGWLFGIHFMNWLTWGPFLSALMSVFTCCLTTLAGAVTLEFYKRKIKDKLFKTKKNDKEEDQTKTAA